MPLRSERRFISLNNVASGIMVEFSYTKIKDDTTKTYTAIVVDPDKDDYLHAMLIDDLNDFEIVSLLTKLGGFTYDPDKRDAPLIDLQTDEVYAKYVSLKGERRYRTFLLKNISGLRQILIGELE